MTARARRRLTLLVVVALAGALLAAGAHPAPAGAVIVEFKEAPQKDAVVRGKVNLLVRAEAPITPLRHFRLSIVSDDRAIPPFAHEVRHPGEGDWNLGDARFEDAIEMVWDTASLTRYNGVYRLVAYAESLIDGEGGGTTETIAGLKVDNPPVAPAGVEAALSEGVPTVTWKPNPEPDVKRYRVLRTDAGRTPIQVADVAATSYRDVGAPHSVEVSYQVVAVRASRVSSAGVASAPSKPTAALVLAPPAEPQPLSIPAPQAPPPPPPPQVKPKVVVAPRPQGPAFDPVLPYQSPPPGAEAPEPAEAEAGGAPVVVQEEAAGDIAARPDKTPFLAGALLLVIAALHVARASRRMLSE